MNKALLVGINKYAKQSPLYGCLNDVDDVKLCLVSCGTAADAIVTLQNENATKDSILAQLNRLIKESVSGDHLYVHFSCHGVRMPSTDVDEPDGADEALCPYEFDWTPETAIIDNEILAAVDALPGGVRLTFVADSCHSGDFSRDLVVPPGIPRTLHPPDSVKKRLVARAVGRGLRAMGSARCTFVSACLPWQTAADTSFDGRPNGAFTHNFLNLVEANSAESLDQTISRLTPILAAYEMTPVLEGSEEERGMPYVSRLGDNLVGGRRRALARRSMVLRRDTTVFDQAFQTNVFGQLIGITFRITASGAELTGTVEVNFLSSASWSFTLDGNTCFPIDLALGVKLNLTVSDWEFATDSIRFSLGIDILPPWLPAVRVARIPVSIPFAAFVARDALATFSSPAEVAAFLQLRGGQLSSGALSGLRRSEELFPGGLNRLPARAETRAPFRTLPREIRREGDYQLQSLAEDFVEYGWGTKLNTIITPRSGGVLQGFVRDGEPKVELVPGSDGWCAFQGWVSEELNDLRFYLHIGSTWAGKCHWEVLGHATIIHV